MAKLIKDPIYGYIKIDNKYILDLLDSISFQRLRNIKQTGYSSLYPASVHNRFIHSIGVYYLGNKLINALLLNSEAKEKSIINEQKNSFLLACFLHDVGHAPFSHSGEKFFLIDKDEFKQPLIYKMMIDLVNDDDFSKDARDMHKIENAAAKPHEIMSVIIGLDLIKTKNYNDLTIDKAFFARCITGYLYSEKGMENSIKNCLISLLNSSVIDVDKLDYTLRDTYMTGFNSTSIDIERLFSGVKLAINTQKTESSIPVYELTYHKNALSIIENVIYANDSERKWIQTHPVVLYEISLVQSLIKMVDRFYSNGKHPSLFSFNSLTEKGQIFSEIFSIRLLSDEDIIFTAKNLCNNNISDEFFAREKRRKPLWKTEAEYNTLFTRQLGPDKLDILEKQIIHLEKILIKKFDSPLINQNVLDIYSKELNEIENNTGFNEDDKNDLIKGRKDILKWLTGFKKIADKHNLDFDFSIVSSQNFNSGFNKDDVNNIRVWFPSIKKYNYIKEVQPILESSTYREKMFFIYYRKKKKDVNITDNPINIETFVSDFIIEFIFS